MMHIKNIWIFVHHLSVKSSRLISMLTNPLIYNCTVIIYTLCTVIFTIKCTFIYSTNVIIYNCVWLCEIFSACLIYFIKMTQFLHLLKIIVSLLNLCLWTTWIILSQWNFSIFIFIICTKTEKKKTALPIIIFYYYLNIYLFTYLFIFFLSWFHISHY